MSKKTNKIILKEQLSFLSKLELAILSHFSHNENYESVKTYLNPTFNVLGKIQKNKSDLEARELNETDDFSFLKEIFKAKFLPKSDSDFTFIDLFAGIGGFRVAAQNEGGRCVFSSEWDEKAQLTYQHNFGEVPFGDITKKEIKNLIPENFDLLCGGFPCQAFSIAGYQKGFEDTRGTLFFDVAEIIKKHKPKAVFLENVKNLVSHDGGKTFQVIKKTLEDLGYLVHYQVLNASEYANVPQNRERIFIVGFNKEKVPNAKSFEFPQKRKLTKTISDCIDYSNNDSALVYTERFGHYSELIENMKNINTLYQWRRQYVRENKSNLCPTLTANMGTGGHNVPLILTPQNVIRKLSPKECLNFQGFPKNYEFPKTIAYSSMYKQAGNSVVVPAIQAVCHQIRKILFPHS